VKALNAFSYGLASLFIGFLFTPLIFSLTNFNLGSLMFGASAIICIVGVLIFSKRLGKTVPLFLGILFLWLMVYSVIVPRIEGISVMVSLKQLGYYMKPILFFLIGYLFISIKRFTSLMLLAFWITTVGTVLFFLKSNFFITAALERNPDGQGIAHFFAIGGRYIRNCSVYLSPLDTAFICFFLTAFFHQKGKTWFLMISFACLVLTMTRSAIIAAIVYFCAHQFFIKKWKNRVIYLFMLIISLGVVIIVFSSKLEFLFLKDGSASMHVSNLLEVATDLLRIPFGHGIGYSGWSSIGQKNHLYSEGSFQATILENGFLFAVFYVFIGYALFKKDKTVSLPIYIGFFVASLMIPIGFSTLFNLIFFTYLGVILKSDEIKNSYNNYQLE